MTTPPPAGMQFREYTNARGTVYRYADGLECRHPDGKTWFPAESVCTDDIVPVGDLMANPLEPAPPEPVVRDATWTRVHELIDHVWGVATAYERNGRNPIAWEGTEAATDAILRAVRDSPLSQRFAHVLSIQHDEATGPHSNPYMVGLYNGMLMMVCNVDNTEYKPLNPRRKALLAEGADAAALKPGVKCADHGSCTEHGRCMYITRGPNGTAAACVEHRAEREAVLAACGVTEQTADPLAAQVREAVNRVFGDLCNIVHDTLHEAIEDMGECARVKAEVAEALSAYDAVPPAPLTAAGHVAALVAMGWEQREAQRNFDGSLLVSAPRGGPQAFLPHIAVLLAPAETTGVEK